MNKGQKHPSVSRSRVNREMLFILSRLGAIDIPCNDVEQCQEGCCIKCNEFYRCFSAWKKRNFRLCKKSRSPLWCERVATAVLTAVGWDSRRIKRLFKDMPRTIADARKRVVP